MLRLLALSLITAGSLAAANCPTCIQDAVKERLTTLINQERAAGNANKDPLTLDPNISAVEQPYSESLAAEQTAPSALTRYRVIASFTPKIIRSRELVATSTNQDDPASDVVRQWLAQTKTRSHLLGAYNRIGYGVDVGAGNKFYITLFILQTVATEAELAAAHPTPPPSSPVPAPVPVPEPTPAPTPDTRPIQDIPDPDISLIPSSATYLHDFDMQAVTLNMHNQINAQRAQHNLPPLTLNPIISQIVQPHSDLMAYGLIGLSHQGATDRYMAINKVLGVQKAGGENCAGTFLAYDPVTWAVNAWMNSPGHRANILGDYDETGFGIAKTENGDFFYTQFFIKH